MRTFFSQLLHVLLVCIFSIVFVTPVMAQFGGVQDGAFSDSGVEEALNSAGFDGSGSFNDGASASTLSRSRLQDVTRPSYGGDVTNLDGETGIKSLISQILRVALGFLGTIFFALVIYAGYLWMTAGGNDDQIAQSRKIFVTSIIGLVIVAAAFIISSFVLQSIQQVVPGGH